MANKIKIPILRQVQATNQPLLRFADAERPYEPTNRKARRSCKRVRTGCLTCKIRRVKCDEGTPACKRCTSTGRKCDGYPQLAITKSTARESHARKEPSTFVLQAVSTRSNTFHDSCESRSFDHFLNRTAFQLAGCFDFDFWGRWLPQAVYHEPVIKHAVIALSALHERFQSSDPVIYKSAWSHSDGVFALQQYNQAIRLLTKPDKGCRPPVDVCLIACILFACFEAIRGHHGSAISHITSGVNIFAEMNGGEKGIQSSQQGSRTLSSKGYVSLAHLQVLFNRLDFQKLQMIGSQPMALAAHHGEGAPGFCASIPTSFSSIEEARNSLAYHASQCTIILDSPDRYSERAPYLEMLAKWGSAVNAFQSQNLLSARIVQAIRLLQVNQKFMEMSFAVPPTSITNRETDWDLHLEDCKEIVSLASEALQTSPDALDGVQQRPSFCFDGVLVGPLFAVGHKCRDPFVRREAARLLKKYPRQEGIWDSVLAGRVVDKLISLEEQGLGTVDKSQDVPDCARLNEVQVTFDIEGKLGTIWYKRRLGSPLTGTLIRQFKDHIKW